MPRLMASAARRNSTLGTLFALTTSARQARNSRCKAWLDSAGGSFSDRVRRPSAKARYRTSGEGPADFTHSLGLLLPANIHVSNEKRICKLRAAPAVPRINDKKAVPARFDCLRPGQVRVIFRLPTWMGGSEPLLYIHWFRSFRTPDTIAGLPATSHSTRAGRRNASVVSIRDLVRTCHLMPRLGHEDLDGAAAWLGKDADVLDERSVTFLLNRYYDFHTFDALSK
ncbi:hypothetical protein NUW54_g3028 [Trametes sanguinea]|uniref:Uncharacterized protein n=1 Tax=Trametes sanguinea TaxID=158606 RepID=A0ACC1Q1X5_9APHY|nr:hypothetical protein NUW54_g3028 [Trametes sanguinea]